jgi:hypothetical protein
MVPAFAHHIAKTVPVARVLTKSLNCRIFPWRGIGLGSDFAAPAAILAGCVKVLLTPGGRFCRYDSRTDLSPLLRIETNNRTSGVGRSGSAGRTGTGVDFVPAGGDAPARVASAAPMAGLTGIDAILALQAVDGPLEGKKKSIRRGRSLLDTLDEIKADLLIGRVSADKLDALVAMLGEVRERSLPGLDAVLDDIELRVRVELAKFGRFPAA